jgi:transcriptional regulator with PAS, ATPase and Fis domain
MSSLEALRASEKGDGLLAFSPAMQTVVAQARKFAPSTVPLLILGETGTGKEKLAQLVHRSSRRQGPFIAINCAAIPANLMESELFGHEKGSFTGATTDREGLFDAAKGGSLFLDEIGELAPHLQAGSPARPPGKIHPEGRLLQGTSRWMSASSPPPTGTWTRWCAMENSGKTFCSG